MTGKIFEYYCERIHSLAGKLVDAGGRIQIMEVCGSHTMSIARAGLKSLLPESVKLISGPGCPVCVTDQSYIDQAIGLARSDKDIVIATYGDMVRVPGRVGSLAEARADGAQIEVIYSADYAVEIAKARPDKQVVFLAVGFETTAPGAALAVLKAKNEGVDNFSIFTAHKLVLPIMDALLAAGDVRVNAFLCPGHVSVILGYDAYKNIASKYRRPCVAAGFDPAQVMAGIAEILTQLAEDDPKACSVYPAVKAEGNIAALKLLDDVFAPATVPWRAVGVVPESGLELRSEYAEFDTAKRFNLPEAESYELPGCRCGDVICGRVDPVDCPLFGTQCTPMDPIGPCMVSSEGACAAAYKYRTPEQIRAARGNDGK